MAHLTSIKARRSELLAESLFIKNKVEFVQKASSPDAGYDYIIGMAGPDGVKTYAVNVKATEDLKTFIKRKRGRIVASKNSSLPLIELVADVKANKLYSSSIKEGNRIIRLKGTESLASLEQDGNAIAVGHCRPVNSPVKTLGSK